MVHNNTIFKPHTHTNHHNDHFPSRTELHLITSPTEILKSKVLQALITCPSQWHYEIFQRQNNFCTFVFH